PSCAPPRPPPNKHCLGRNRTMNPFEMVVAIIVIVTIGRVLQARYRAGGGDPSRHQTAQDSAEAIRLREEVRSLKERIAVLERVITDNHSSVELEREIDRLRDDNRV